MEITQIFPGHQSCREFYQWNSNRFTYVWNGPGSVNDQDKGALLPIATALHELGFELVATDGTSRYLNENSIPAQRIFKVNEGRPNIEDAIINGEIHLVINTPFGKVSHQDESAIRRTAIRHGVPCITTLSGAEAAIEGIKGLREGTLPIYALQDYNKV